MNRFIAPALACFVAAAASIVIAGPDIKSGMDIGESTTAFNVRDVTGPSKGKTLCYRCQYGAKPVAAIFTREITPEVADGPHSAILPQVTNGLAVRMAVLYLLLGGGGEAAA